ncbi:MAG: hypothetical protein ACI9LA_002006, partial [Bacteroidia bacterium]
MSVYQLTAKTLVINLRYVQILVLKRVSLFLILPVYLLLSSWCQAQQQSSSTT